MLNRQVIYAGTSYGWRYRLYYGATCFSASPPPILAETPFVIAIPDKFPAAKHHFLVIPKRHIDNAKCLTADDRGLWEEMMRVGKELVLNEIEDEGER